MSSFLQVRGQDIVKNGEPIILKGGSLGGWMTMENFISGFPGHEHQLRESLTEVLGEDKAGFFFDKFLEYYFTEDDAKLYASFGFNSIRLPINYRHFEDDSNPRIIKESGFKHLDRVIDLCAKYGIYSIIDLHTAPGGQSQGWHCDSGISHATFWRHKDFQDRAVNLWVHIAERYKNNTWVAGYNPLNEPAIEKVQKLLDWYVDVERAIRKVDPNHMLFLDGNTYGADFRGFTGDPLPNSVYACHDYSAYGFPNPPELFTGATEQVLYHENNFERKTEFTRRISGPIWVGEWGPVYASAKDGYDNWREINETRYEVAKNQLEIFARSNASWAIWLYKDIGFQGIVSVGEETAWMKLVGSANERKKRLAADQWGVDDKEVRHIFDPLIKWVAETVPSIAKRYPPTWKVSRHVSRVIREQLVSEELLKEYVELFRGKSEEDLDELAKSFLLSNCTKRDRLCEILANDAMRTARIANGVDSAINGSLVGEKTQSGSARFCG